MCEGVREREREDREADVCHCVGLPWVIFRVFPRFCVQRAVFFFFNLMYFTSLSSLLPENFRGFGLDEAYFTGRETELWGNKVPGAELHAE